MFTNSMLTAPDPHGDTRATLRMQIRKRGLLDALCSSVGWAQVNEHDSLACGLADIKQALPPYFLGKRKFGPSLDPECDSHASKPRSAAVNTALNIASMGFHGAYGQAVDNRTQGRPSERESDNAKAHDVSTGFRCQSKAGSEEMDIVSSDLMERPLT